MTEERRVRITHVEYDEDGTSIEYHSEDLPLPANDPFVRDRFRDVGPPRTPTGVFTHYAASSERPTSLLPELPFIADREFFTTESPDGLMSISARWRCDDPDTLIAQVVDASVADGWTTVPSPLPLDVADRPQAVLRRGDVTRIVMKFEADDVRVVQLLDAKGL